MKGFAITATRTIYKGVAMKSLFTQEEILGLANTNQIIHQVAYKEGHKAGYAEGFRAGKAAECAESFKAGKEEGRKEVWKEVLREMEELAELAGVESEN